MIAIATIGLSFLTQQGAKLLGIELPDQANITVVKNCLAHAFASWKAFGIAAFLVAQVIVLLPAIEEVVFRWGLFKMVYRLVVVRLLSRPQHGEGVRQETRDAGGDEGVRRETRDAGRDEGVRRETRDTGRDEGVRHETRDAGGAAPVLRVPSRAVLVISFLSSALFSAAHYIAQPWPDSAFLALFFFGLAQCWLYRRTGRLWCAITNHALFNLTNLILLFLV